LDATKKKKTLKTDYVLAQVTGKRKRQVGLIVPAKFQPSQQNYVLQEFWIENLMGDW